MAVSFEDNQDDGGHRRGQDNEDGCDNTDFLRPHSLLSRPPRNVDAEKTVSVEICFLVGEIYPIREFSV